MGVQSKDPDISLLFLRLLLVTTSNVKQSKHTHYTFLDHRSDLEQTPFR